MQYRERVLGIIFKLTLKIFWRYVICVKRRRDIFVKKVQFKVVIAVVHVFINKNWIKDSVSSVASGAIFIYDFSEQSWPLNYKNIFIHLGLFSLWQPGIYNLNKLFGLRYDVVWLPPIALSYVTWFLGKNLYWWKCLYLLVL